MTDDRSWSEDQWLDLVQDLVDRGLVTWQEVASAVLGELNPPQVGTGVASKASFKAQFPPRKAWQAVKKWFYAQSGQCEDCGTRLHLEAEHVRSREELREEADRLDNLQLLCKRCNAIKRPSHRHAGETFLTAQAALMWILLVRRPTTYRQYRDLCREYGLTMADIRFQEAWAQAVWLSRHGEYVIEDHSAGS